MHFDFVDIGTSDFDTSLDESSDATVLLVEPLKFYLDNIRDRPNLYKENSAVSYKSGKCQIRFIPPEVIQDYSMPWWLRGCNSLDIEHPTAATQLESYSLPADYMHTVEAKMITFDQLCEKYSIESIGTLKIDTEGHEEFILPDVLTKIQNGFSIMKIKFENQSSLGNPKFLDKLTERFIECGYVLTEKSYTDVVLEIGSVVQR